ncbi:MAG: GNAT family N-acetyltransferase [Spirochaetaceae bacterium]|nr:GNAT family N-acetyltransferase [Spirochaetaceae bacterium]
MKWSVTTKTDFGALLDFILEKEWEHTFVTTRLLENGVFTLPPRSKYPILVLKVKNRIKAACMVTIWGALFPVFKIDNLPDDKEMKELAGWLKKNIKNVYSIMGTEERVQFLSSYVTWKTGTQINYDLMVKEHNFLIPLEPDIPDFQIKKACPDDSAVLLSLELAYQKEEVFLDPTLINNSQIYHNLRSTLNDQEVFYVTSGLRPLAKAGTNAIGHKWNQIGGVYTDEKFRNHGISTWLMNHILNILEKDGKKTVLFVKEDNHAAEKVYTKLGFVIVKKFNIIYFI